MMLTIRKLLIAFAASLSVCSVAVSAPTSPIAPGDIIFGEFYNGWHKLDPVTGVVTPLPWPASSVFTQHVAFDIDGAILYDDFDGDLRRLNPLTGRITTLDAPPVTTSRGFAVEPGGDLLIPRLEGVDRYSRTTGQTTQIVGGTFFSPSDITYGSNDRIFITEFFEDLWELESTTGNRVIPTSPELSIPSLIEVRSDGGLIVENFTPGVFYRINPDTGALALFTDDVPTFVRDIALDANDAMWLTSTDGIFRYDSAGGPATLIASGEFFSPRAMAIVPLGWTPPPIPEPSAKLLAFSGGIATAVFARRSKKANSKSKLS